MGVPLFLWFFSPLYTVNLTTGDDPCLMTSVLAWKPDESSLIISELISQLRQPQEGQEMHSTVCVCPYYLSHPKGSSFSVCIFGCFTHQDAFKQKITPKSPFTALTRQQHIKAHTNFPWPSSPSCGQSTPELSGCGAHLQESWTFGDN